MGDCTLLGACSAAMLMLLLLSGCAQQGGRAMANAAIDYDARFDLPGIEVPYHAVYEVQEGGPMQKEVWRTAGSMRVDLSMQGVRAFSFYFINSRAYSCSLASQQMACYDVTSSLSQSNAAKLVPTLKDVEGAAVAESVDIGGVRGSCYETRGPPGARKLCFAPGGIVAYDSYNVSRGVEHIEYLALLEYYPPGKGPDAQVFALPSEPRAAPSAQAGIGGLPPEPEG